MGVGIKSPITSEQSRISLDAIRSRAMLGDGLALISAIFGAICVIFLKIRIKEESRVDMMQLDLFEQDR